MSGTLSLRSVARAAALLVTLALCGACSFLIDLAADQCQTDADCAGFGATHRCSAGTCVPPITNVVDGGEDQDAAIPCTSNAQCIEDHVGEPYICDKTSRSCVSVKLGATCAYVSPESELKSDSAVLFGAFIPLNNQLSPLGQPVPLAYQLALSEIQKAGGLPGGTGNPRRPLVAVFCDSDPAFVELGVKHLTQTLHVPAVVSLFSQTDTTRLFQDYLLPAKTFTLNPQDTTEALKAINAERLLWHLLGTPEDVALAYRPLIKRVEAHAKAAYGVTTTRLALVTSATPTEESMTAIVRDPDNGIVFNNASSGANGGNFLSIKIPSKEADPTATYGTYVDQLAAFKPDIVMVLTSSLEVGPIIGGFNVDESKYTPALDEKLKAAGSRLPLYVLGVRNARAPEVMSYVNTAFVEPTENKRKRFFGVQYAGAADRASPQSQYQKFLQRFADQNPNVPVSAYAGVENFYDAIYWIAYGLYAAGPGAPLQGSSFAEGVRKLLVGPEINPGTVSQITDGFAAFAIKNEATFVGALGKPDFDTASGAQRSVGGVYCYVQDQGAITPKYDVLRYDPTTKDFTGTFDCFIGTGL